VWLEGIIAPKLGISPQSGYCDNVIGIIAFGGVPMLEGGVD